MKEGALLDPTDRHEEAAKKHAERMEYLKTLSDEELHKELRGRPLLPATQEDMDEILKDFMEIDRAERERAYQKEQKLAEEQAQKQAGEKKHADKKVA